MTHPLRRFRERENLTLDAVASLTGLSKASLSRIENGRQLTTEATIRRVIEATGGKLTANDFIATAPSSGPVQ